MKSLFFFIISPLLVFSQFFESNLPIIVINTNGNDIVDEPRILCDMGIINNGLGEINCLTDSFTDYNGKISIEIRGSTSQNFPKKSYALETQDLKGNNNNVSLLNMPSENDWILYAPYSDKSLMRNFLIFYLGNKLGRYNTRTKYCELVINGDYKGIYILMEKIKRDNNRVDIAKLNKNDISGDDLTGGYIIKIDKFSSTTDKYWISNYNTIGGDQLYFQYHYPKYGDMSNEQRDYIRYFIDDFENSLYGKNFSDSIIGYANYIDISSFVDFYIINEFAKNIDGYRLSTFMYKDKSSNGGKLIMGPLWDYNLAFGNAEYCSGWNTSGWQQDGSCFDLAGVPFWFERLLEDTTYQNTLKCRWYYLRQSVLKQEKLLNFIDSISYHLDDAMKRNFERWDILGTNVTPNYFVGKNYDEEIFFLKNWIIERLTWMDENIPPCNSERTITTFNKKLAVTVDVLGRASRKNKHHSLLYIYYPGNVYKQVITH